MEHMRIEVTEHSLTLQSNDPANDEIFLGLNFILSYLTFFLCIFRQPQRKQKITQFCIYYAYPVYTRLLNDWFR